MLFSHHPFLRLPILLFVCVLPHIVRAQVSISFDQNKAPLLFGVEHLTQALAASGHQVKQVPQTADATRIDIRIDLSPVSYLSKEGYELYHQNKTLFIRATDPAGGMYGILEVAEQIRMGKTWQTIQSKRANPHFSVRAIKFNLPWSSYRTGPAMDQHLEVCRDLAFWQRFLDQMALNRFNVLSLWNVHPFSYMVKPTHFPLANAYTEEEMKEWKQFWTALFRMAKDRGIEPYIVNWNIAVSPEFARNYGVQERNDTSAIVKRYTREVVTQVIDEYPDLAGIGITLADWMSNFDTKGTTLPVMTPKDREDWMAETVVAGIKAASRPVKFLHRSVLSADPAEMRRVIDEADFPDTTLVEIKFNWSHGHSTPVLALTHDSHSGKRDDGYWNPLPTNYRIQWMIRNEDFFILRWGQPDFIRNHITKNTQTYVNGYFVGSEGYIPAKEFAHMDDSHRNWEYAFEKQWLFYMLWGRLLYDPSTPNSVFEQAFALRYGNKHAKALLSAYTLASQMPLQLASYFASTWDYTLYSEGFLAPFSSGKGFQDTVSAFISIDELIDHSTLDPSYVSIKDFVTAITNKQPLSPQKIRPDKLAYTVATNSEKVLELVKTMRKKASPALACELDDLETWAYLGKYFADKLRAGVALQTYRITHHTLKQQEAKMLLTACVLHWNKVCRLTEKHYRKVPYMEGYVSGEKAYQDARYFSWASFLPQVERDVDLAEKTIDSGTKSQTK